LWMVVKPKKIALKTKKHPWLHCADLCKCALQPAHDAIPKHRNK